MRTTTPQRPTRPQSEPQVVTSRRFERRLRARRWLVWRRVLLGAALLTAVVLAVWLVFFSSVLSVTRAEVRGVDLLTVREVQRAADVPVGVPLATANLAAVQARVEALPEVRSAVVSRSWPDAVRIEVTERTPVAAVAWEGRWRALDSQGVLFRTFTSRPAGLLEVTMRATTPADALAEAARVVGGLPRDVRRRVARVEVRSIDAISLRLRNGAVVHWGSAEDSGKKAEVLRLLLRRGARAYDVTAPGRPTIRG